MKNLKYILIALAIIGILVLLRSCDSTWTPIKSVFGIKADTVTTTRWREVLVPVQQLRFDTIKAVLKFYYPITMDSLILVRDSSLVAERDSLSRLLTLAGVRINATCDTTRGAVGDSVPKVILHIEYDELSRVFHNTTIDVGPIHARYQEQTNTITQIPKWSIGIGGGFGFNSSVNMNDWRPGWNIGIQVTYNLWSF